MNSSAHTSDDREAVIYGLYWEAPQGNTIFPAGIAYFSPKYGEYLLKIDEEPFGKQYFLKPVESSQGRVEYRMGLAIVNKAGRFLKRQVVGKGFRDETTGQKIHIDFGSKYKTLTLDLKQKK